MEEQIIRERQLFSEIREKLGSYIDRLQGAYNFESAPLIRFDLSTYSEKLKKSIDIYPCLGFCRVEIMKLNDAIDAYVRRGNADYMKPLKRLYAYACVVLSDMEK